MNDQQQKNIEPDKIPTPKDQERDIIYNETPDMSPAEQVLEDNEQQMRLITETISEAFWMSDYKTERILYISSAYERIWGKPLRSLYENPRSYIEVVIDEDKDIALTNFEMKKSGLPWDLHYRIRRPDGEISWIWDRGYPIFEPSGQVAYYVGLAQDITERKMAEEKLQQSEEKYRLLFENAPIGILTVNSNGRILDVNSSLISILGSPSVEETKKINIFSFPLLVKSGFSDAIRNVFMTGNPAFGERQYTSKWGRELYFQYKITPINIRGTEVESVQVILEDITARKQVEEALMKSEEKFRNVFDHSTIGISITAVDGKVSVNRAICDMLGYTKQEFEGKTWKDVTHPDDHEETNLEIALLLNRKKAYTRLTQRYIKKDGTVIWGELSSVLQRDKDNQPLYFISCIVDITKKRQAEEEIRKLYQDLEMRVTERTAELENVNRTLKETNQLLDAHMANSMMAIIEFDKDLRIIRWSGEAERLFGRKLEEINNKKIGDIQLIHPDDMKEVALMFEDMRSGKLPNTLNVNRNLRKDGSIFYCEWYNSAIYDEEGKLQSILCSGIDITGRRQMEQELKESEERLQKAFRIAPSIIAFSNPETGEYMEVNDEFCRYTGFSREEAIGKTPMDLHLFDTGVWEKLSGEFRKFGKIMGTDVVVKPKNGERAYIEFSSETVQHKGKIMILSMGKDITERMRIEDNLRLMQFAIDNGSDETFWITPEGNFEYVNDAACRILGYTMEELLALNIYDIDPVFTPEKWKERWTVLKNLGSSTIETHHITKNGHLFPVEVKGNYIKYSGREFICAFARDITERKQAEKALKESEAKYQFIVENSDDLLWTMDGNLKIDYISPSVIKFMGYTPEEHRQLNLDDYFTPESAAMVKQEFAEGLKNLAMKKYEKLRDHAVLDCQFVRKDKSTGYCRVKMTMIRDEHYNITKIRGVTTDITEQKLAEMALQQSEALLNEAGEIAKIGGWEIDLADNKLTWTKEVRKLHEVPDDYIPDVETAINFYDEDSRELIRDAVNSAVNEGKSFDLELGFITSKGNRLRVRALGYAKTDNNGKVIAVKGIFRDITERIQNRFLLRLYSSMFHNLAEGIFILGLADLTIKWVNPKFENMFGYDESEMIGMHVDAINLPVDPGQLKVRGSIYDILIKDGEWHGEVENIKKDGTRFWCHVNISLFEHPEFGKVTIASHFDISEYKKG